MKSEPNINFSGFRLGYLREMAHRAIDMVGYEIGNHPDPLKHRDDMRALQSERDRYVAIERRISKKLGKPSEFPDDFKRII